MSFHLYVISEVYSNADGSVQYIELSTSAAGQHVLGGHAITGTQQGALTHSFTFPGNLPSSATANTTVLIATQGFADLGLVTPDYIIPNRPDGAPFLYISNGKVDFAGVDSVTYTSFPGGAQSISHSGASITNFMWISHASHSQVAFERAKGAGSDRAVVRVPQWRQAHVLRFTMRWRWCSLTTWSLTSTTSSTTSRSVPPQSWQDSG